MNRFIQSTGLLGPHAIMRQMLADPVQESGLGGHWRET